MILSGLSAVRTGLEPATSGVTGRHSNQAELPHRFCLFPSFPKGIAKIYRFCLFANFFAKIYCDFLKNEKWTFPYLRSLSKWG